MVKIWINGHIKEFVAKCFCSKIFVSEADYVGLTTHIKKYEKLHPMLSCNVFKKFKVQLIKSKRIPEKSFPDNVIKMNSSVTYKVIETQQILTMQLVYPNEENLKQYKLSIFSTLGMILFGQEVGKSTNYSTSKRKIQIKILNLSHQKTI